MGYFGKLKEKEAALKLRKKGWSYKQIQKRVRVSKNTLSRWCSEIVLTEDQVEKLLGRKLRGAERGRLAAAISKKEKRSNEEKALLSLGEKEVGTMSDREKFIAGIALYAGEGGKRTMEFANSNSKIIRFMMDWFRRFCNVPERKFRGVIWIHDNLDPEKAKVFWSKLTKIPVSQFYKPYIATNKKDSNKIRKNIHTNGVFSVKVFDTKTHRKILGWMSGILNQPLV